MNRRQSNFYKKHRKKKAGSLILAIPILLFILLFVFIFLHAGAAAGESRETKEIVVAAGDTLWSLAAEHGPGRRDVRACIDDIMSLNKLDSPVIQPGQLLYMPW